MYYNHNNVKLSSDDIGILNYVFARAFLSVGKKAPKHDPSAYLSKEIPELLVRLTKQWNNNENIELL